MVSKITYGACKITFGKGGWGFFKNDHKHDYTTIIRTFCTLEELIIWYELEGYSLNDLTIFNNEIY